MKINKLLLEQIVAEETQKALSEVLGNVSNLATNIAQGLSGRSPSGGGAAGSPERPAYDAAAATQQADAEAITTADSQQTLSPTALKAMNSLFTEIKTAGTAKVSTEIIKNVLNFVVNNGLRTLSLSKNMDEQSKKEIAALYKAGVNMHGLISQTQQKIAADDVTAARPAQIAGMAPATKTAPAANKPPSTPAKKPAAAPATGRPKVVARRPAGAASAPTSVPAE